MLKTKHLINLTVVALVLGLVSSAMAIQTKDRTSQGNNFGFQMALSSSVFTGSHEYPRGSGRSHIGCCPMIASSSRFALPESAGSRASTPRLYCALAWHQQRCPSWLEDLPFLCYMRGVKWKGRG